MFLEMLLERDISKFNSQKFTKSILHKQLEENSISPIVGFLAKIVQEKLNSGLDTYKVKTSTFLKQFTDCAKESNLKYEVSQKVFNVDLENKYHIEKTKNSNNYFVINIKQLCVLLEEKYKIVFTKPENDEADYENGVDKTKLGFCIEDKYKELEQKYKELEEKYNALIDKPTKQDWFGEKPKKVTKNIKKELQEDFDDIEVDGEDLVKKLL
jgi:hypothetical protein